MKDIKTKIKNLPENIQQKIIENWDNLSNLAQWQIFELIETYEQYLQSGIKNAIENNEKFYEKFNEFVNKRKKDILNKIEKQEKNDELKDLENQLN